MVNRVIFILACVIAVMTAGAQESYDTNRGFRHPGGLHTQDDFERIKALLAAGDETVTAALNVLRTAAYAQASAATYPSETIVRGGGVGENYINAARGAAIAYQNALRWKIDGNTACAKHASVWHAASTATSSPRPQSSCATTRDGPGRTSRNSAAGCSTCGIPAP